MNGQPTKPTPAPTVTLPDGTDLISRLARLEAQSAQILQRIEAIEERLDDTKPL